MKRAVHAVAVLLLAAVTSADTPAAKADPQTEKVKRGKYLVTVGGCNDCHTPMKMTPDGPAPDMEWMLAGHPEGAPDPGGTLGPNDLALTATDLTTWKQQFGTVYTRNLTPDKTGLGDWTEAQFVKTLRTGRHQGDGRALLPPMPWIGYAEMTDEDLQAVWAYLRTLKPIRNVVPDPRVPPPVLEQFGKINQRMIDAMKARQ
jgi:mono/diheme cytochrome c family protein